MRCRVRVTGVVTGGVGVPDVNEDVGDRLTGLDVDDTNVHDLRATGLARCSANRRQAATYEEQSGFQLSHVVPHRVTNGVVVRALGNLRGQDTGVVLDLAPRNGIAGQDSLIVLVQVLSFDSLDLGREVLPSTVNKELLVGPRGVRKCTLRPGPLTFGVVHGNLRSAEVGGLLEVLQSVFLVGSLCLDFRVGYQGDGELWR